MARAGHTARAKRPPVALAIPARQRFVYPRRACLHAHPVHPVTCSRRLQSMPQTASKSSAPHRTHLNPRLPAHRLDFNCTIQLRLPSLAPPLAFDPLVLMCVCSSLFHIFLQLLSPSLLRGKTDTNHTKWLPISEVISSPPHHASHHAGQSPSSAGSALTQHDIHITPPRLLCLRDGRKRGGPR